jgi:hypothetical protein
VEIEDEIYQLIDQQRQGTRLTIDSYKKLEKLIHKYRFDIRFQLLFLNTLQIGIAFLAVLIAGRFIPGWGDRFATYIFSGILLSSLVIFWISSD